jgi:hypothetical protein
MDGSMSKTNSIRLVSVTLALLLGSLGHERWASATDLPDNNVFTNFTLGNQPNSEGVIYTTGAIIDYPYRLAPSKRKVSYMVPVGFNAQRVPVVTGKKFGLVVVLHGGGGNGAAFATDFYTNLIGSGYAFVFPWAATWPAGGTHFQTVGTGGTNCDGGPLPRSNANVTGTDCLEDVKFVEYMIDGIVKSNPQIDASKIFLVGHSNGAGLAFTMVCWGSKFKVNGVNYAIAGFAMSGKALGGVKQELWCGNSNANPASFPAAFSNAVVGFTGIPTRYGLDYGNYVVPLAFHFGLADDAVQFRPLRRPRSRTSNLSVHPCGFGVAA